MRHNLSPSVLKLISIEPIFPISQGAVMYTNNSPLEHLAAFAIVFVAGAITTAIGAKWIEKIKRDAASGQ